MLSEGPNMTTPSPTLSPQSHDDEHHAPYMTLFFVLLNFTAMEYIYARFHQASSLFFALMGVAVLLTIVTAFFTSMYNLHFNRRWVYLTMVPALLLSIFPIPLI